MVELKKGAGDVPSPGGMREDGEDPLSRTQLRDAQDKQGHWNALFRQSQHKGQHQE